MKQLMDEYGRIVLRIVIFLMCSVLVGGVYYHMKDIVFDPNEKVAEQDTDIEYPDIPEPPAPDVPVAPTYIATYNVNTDSAPIGKVIPESTPMSFEIRAGSKYTDYIPSHQLAEGFRINHKFLGWYLNKSGESGKVDNNTVVDPALKTNVILYAHWENLNYTMTISEPIKYTGTPVNVTEYVKQGGKSLTENTDFTASYIDNVPHDGEIYIDATAIATGKGNHPTLYLTQPYRVIRQDYDVIYDMNTGTGTIPKQVQYWGMPITLSTVKPTKIGWTFTRWNTKANGTGKPFDSGAEFMENAATTLYAQYRANKYKIVYDANRPTNSIIDDSNIDVTNQTDLSYDSVYYFKDNTYRTKGYTAAGWNTRADGTGTPYTPGTSFSNLTATDNGTVTLYAQWIDEDPTIEITSILPEVYKADTTLNYTNSDVAVVVAMTDYGVGLDKLELVKGSPDNVQTLATYNAEKEKTYNYTATFRIMDDDDYYFKVYDKLGHTAQVKVVLPHIDKVNPEILVSN